MAGATGSATGQPAPEAAMCGEAGGCTDGAAGGQAAGSEAGASGTPGHATPVRTRAEAVGASDSASGTLHTNSVANTAKRRQKRKGGHLRARKVADAALAVAVEEQDAKRARDAPPSDEPPDDTGMT